MGTKGDIKVAREIEGVFGSMRMVLPQHKAEIQQMKVESVLVERPIIDEEDFGEMCFRVYDSTQYNYPITVKWFREVRSGLGIVETECGVVREIDVDKRMFKLVGERESVWICVEDVVGVMKYSS
jgi:hypothetical protein